MKLPPNMASNGSKHGIGLETGALLHESIPIGPEK